VALGVVAAVSLPAVGLAACGDDPAEVAGPATTTERDRDDGTTTTSTVAPAPTTTAPPTTEPPVATTTTAPPAPPAPPGPAMLRQGAEGPEVADLQQRLSALGYWTGSPAGVFDSGTHHAVVALQKAAGLGRDGVVGPATRSALDQGVRPAARSGSGLVVEIDREHQLLLVVRDGWVELVFDTSTGSVPGSTPAGQWSVTRQIDGYRRSDLGLLYRPKYFYEGVAVHGYTSVPPQPASHGCVRVTYPAMDHLWASGSMPVGTPVWVY
jgi:peptidoglycan hydrolase-like protein with peptidoglycan-binding domain